MTEADENADVRKAAETAVKYESAFEGYIQSRPLAAIVISVVVGAILAKFVL